MKQYQRRPCLIVGQVGNGKERIDVILALKKVEESSTLPREITGMFDIWNKVSRSVTLEVRSKHYPPKAWDRTNEQQIHRTPATPHPE